MEEAVEVARRDGVEPRGDKVAFGERARVIVRHLHRVIPRLLVRADDEVCSASVVTTHRGFRQSARVPLTPRMGSWRNASRGVPATMALLMGAPHLRPSQGAGEEKRSPCCGLLECMIRVLCDCDVVGMDGSRMDTGEGQDRRRREEGSTEAGGNRARRRRNGNTEGEGEKTNGKVATTAIGCGYLHARRCAC